MKAAEHSLPASAILTSYSASPSVAADQPKQATAPITTQPPDVEAPAETTPLLATLLETDTPKARHGRLAGLVGFSTGTGALLAVFGLLRLPAILAQSRDPEQKDPKSLKHAVHQTFFIVAIFAWVSALFVTFGLKSFVPAHAETAPRVRSPRGTMTRDQRRAWLRERNQRAGGGAAVASRGWWRTGFDGFTAAWSDKTGHTALAYASSLSGRAVALTVTFVIQLACMVCSTLILFYFYFYVSVFVPLLVAQFYYREGLCGIPVPGSDMKKV